MLSSLFRRVSDVLSGKAPLGVARSGKWEAVRKHHLELHPLCEVCGRSKNLQVHHIMPFHLDPSLELSETNLITLCESNSDISCHITFGHLMNFKSHNVNVVEDAAIWNKKIKTRPI